MSSKKLHHFHDDKNLCLKSKEFSRMNDAFNEILDVAARCIMVLTNLKS